MSPDPDRAPEEAIAGSSERSPRATARGAIAETTVSDGVLQLCRPGTEWLSTGFDGGRTRGAAAYNVSVPEGWDRPDLRAYADERLAAAGFEEDGPVLLTGVDLEHARAARAGPVVAVVTAGLSNPAALFADGCPRDRERNPPVNGNAEGPTADGDGTDSTPEGDSMPGGTPGVPAPDESGPSDGPRGPGTVNVLLVVERSLPEGALANLVAAAAEAKAATLLRETGVPGTTTDAVIVGTDPEGRPRRFSGAGTEVGDAARACVRDGIRASLESRYDGDRIPDGIGDAEHGTTVETEPAVFEP